MKDRVNNISSELNNIFLDLLKSYEGKDKQNLLRQVDLIVYEVEKLENK